MVDDKTSTACDVIRILIVDDHPIAREGLRSLLSREPDFLIAGAVSTIAEALEALRLEAPDLVIVDLLLGEEHGLDLIRRLKAANGRVRILTCSMYDDELYAERALAAGAQGYINKRSGINNIIKSIRAVMSGEVYVSPHVMQHILRRRLAAEADRPKMLIDSLSNRELEVFRLIGKGMTTAEIGCQLHLSSKTVETHRQNIRRQLQLDNTHKLAREAAQWVLENG